MQRRALEGVKVLDFSWAITGPLLTKYLADYGAAVVRIESHQAPCSLRVSPPYKDGIVDVDRSIFFAYWNPNKYSISLDLNCAAGVEIARKLVGWADIVVENFSAGKMEEWNLGYDDLKKIKPDIIMLRSSNQGQTGPDSRHPGFGLQLAALVGYTHLTGWPDQPPLQAWGAPTDYIAGRFSAAAAVAALIYHRRTGKGQCLDLSQVEVSAQFIAPHMLDYIVNGREAIRMGNACPWAAPHGVYRCQGEDRWCAIAVSTDEEWNALCRAIGKPSLATEPKFATLLARKKNEAELDRLIEEYTLRLTPEEVMAQLQGAGVAAGIVQSAQGVYEDPQLAHRRYFWSQNHSVIGTYHCFGAASILSKTPAELQRPAPCMGEHTEYVCREILKMSDQDFLDALAAGAFGIG